MACEHAHLHVAAPAIEHPAPAETAAISTSSTVSVTRPSPVVRPAPPELEVRPIRFMTRAGPKWKGAVEKPRVITEAKP